MQSKIIFPVWAILCTFSQPDLNFGTVDLMNGFPIDTSTSLNINCTGGTAGDNITVCANYHAGSGGMSANWDPRYATFGSHQLSYNIFSNASYTTVWGATLGLQKPPPILVPIGQDSNGNLSIPVYARIYAGQSLLPVGFYISIFSNYTQIGYKPNAANCAQINNYVNVPFSVTANYIGSCTIATEPLNFGTLNIGKETTAVTTLKVTCPNESPYSIALEGDPTQRFMKSTIDDQEILSYEIYQDSAYQTLWGNTPNVNTKQVTGNASQQVHTLYGKVLWQPRAAVGEYRDSIRVVVTY